MNRIPLLLASSVVRGSRLGQSHGGLFLIDIATGKVEQKLDWNSTDIDVSGRGGDRGLRGIAFYGEHVIVAANAEILLLDREFRWTHTYTCRYLRHCHEIAVAGDLLLVTSTGFDSILTFDLRARSFIRGVQLSYQHGVAVANSFDPQAAHGPAPRQSLHLNSVTATADEIFVSGLHMQELLRIGGEKIAAVAPLPSGTHNAQWFEGNLLYNDTASDRLCYRTTERLITMSVPEYEQHRIHNPERVEPSVARSGFARGLCPVAPGHVAGGSSPSTVSIYHVASGTRTISLNLSMDVRNAIHGVAVWPYR